MSQQFIQIEYDLPLLTPLEYRQMIAQLSQELADERGRSAHFSEELDAAEVYLDGADMEAACFIDQVEKLQQELADERIRSSNLSEQIDRLERLLRLESKIPADLPLEQATG